MLTKLTKEILQHLDRHYFLYVNYTINEDLSRCNFNLENYIKDQIAKLLAEQLLESKIVELNESREHDGSLHFSARMLALTQDDLNHIIELAYQKGRQDEKFTLFTG